jgi:hypothetical protein
MDKTAFAKAVVICGMSWLAIPVLYYMFLKREREDDKQNGKGEVGKAVVETKDTS